MRLLLLLVLLLAACGRTPGAAGADGDTPVRYVICMPPEEACIVTARFSRLEGCERHKEKDAMACVRSEAGHLACAPPAVVSLAVAYCIP